MRIDDLNRIPITPGTDKSGQTAQQRNKEREIAGGSDQAEVSHLARALATPDSGRVEQLRLQVESGNYDVSAQAVAKSLIDAHLKD
jgi:flagellar biosynthesis anti-sigma factor FlgM